MQKTVHLSESRGLTAVGWLVSRHTFSFGNYYDPSRLNFGLLRVLNQDLVVAGEGFGSHHHDNMEIISIPFEGSLEHRDSVGNQTVIKTGDVQIMSAGSGVDHSEFNYSKEEPVQFLQIWIEPKQRNIAPRYEQKSFDWQVAKNQFLMLVSPQEKAESLWINQDAWLFLGDFSKGEKISYELKRKWSGVYLFVLEGSIQVAGESLKKGDGMGIWEIEFVDLEMLANAKFLLIEVPLG